MKVKDIFEVGELNLNPKDSEDDFIELDMDDIEFDELDFQDLVINPFSPQGVRIDPTTFVDLIKDGQLIQSMSWEAMLEWINENFKSLRGTFYVSKRGMVLHQFTLAG